MSGNDQTTLPVGMLPERAARPGAYFRMGCCVFRVVAVAFGRAHVEREGCSRHDKQTAFSAG